MIMSIIYTKRCVCGHFFDQHRLDDDPIISIIGVFTACQVPECDCNLARFVTGTKNETHCETATQN